MKRKPLISFDRKGLCPICKVRFMSDDCPHSWGYVHNVVTQANNQLQGNQQAKDVRKILRN